MKNLIYIKVKHLRKYNEAYQVPNSFKVLTDYKSEYIDSIELDLVNDAGAAFKVRENENNGGENNKDGFNYLFFIRSGGMSSRVYYPNDATFLCDVRHQDSLLVLVEKIEFRIKNRLEHKKMLAKVDEMFEKLDKDAMNNYFSNIIDMSDDYEIEQTGDFDKKIYWSLKFDIRGIQEDNFKHLVINDTHNELFKNLIHINDVLKSEDVLMSYQIKFYPRDNIKYTLEVNVYALSDSGDPIGGGRLKSS